MLFSSITFLYYFLPITLLVYFTVPEKWKNAVLLTASFLFYFWGEPKYCLLMAAVVLAGYLGGIQIERRAVGAGIFFPLLVLGVLLVFKYSGFAVRSINAVLGSGFRVPELLLPVGISFYTFQIISYLIDVHRGDIGAEHNFLRFAAYVTMFPQLIAGPIVRYSSIEGEMKKRRLRWEDVSAGFFRFSCGLAKKVLIADLLSELVSALDALPGKGTAAYWVLAAAFTLQIYYDFSGYSDMAIGLGEMLGFTFPENFRYPLTAKSITEFWRRWHITLGSWFRDYVYIPLGGNRVSFFRWMGNVAAVWFLSGLWHGAGWNFAVWGLYFAFFLIMEKLVLGVFSRKKKGNRKPAGRAAEGMRACLAHIYTIIVVVCSFVIFRLEQPSDIIAYLYGMFGGAAGTEQNAVVWYEIKSYAWLLGIAAFGATPCVRRMGEAFLKKETYRNVRAWTRTAATLVFLALTTAFLLGSTAHPFLYFRF